MYPTARHLLIWPCRQAAVTVEMSGAKLMSYTIAEA